MEMSQRFGLREWPFVVASTTERARVWAGRREVKKAIEKMVRRWAFRRSSSLHLLWSEWGMGKTHTLHYIKNFCDANWPREFVTTYAALPKGTSDFIDIYREIVRGLPMHAIAQEVFERFRYRFRDLERFPPSKVRDVYWACWHLATNVQPEAQVAQSWLHAERGLTLRQCQNVGLGVPNRTATDCVSTLAGLVLALTRSAHKDEKSPQLVVLLDEFQRIGAFREAKRKETCESLHTFFNLAQDGLRLVLSFASGDARNVASMLTGELLDRTSPESVSLTALTDGQAIDFIIDLVNAYRADSEEDRTVFTNAALEKLCEEVRRRRGYLSPRNMIMFSDLVLSEHLLQCEDSPNRPVEAADVAEVLAEIGDVFESEET